MTITPERLKMLADFHVEDMANCCDSDDEAWPCDTRQLLDLLAEKDAEIERLTTAAEEILLNMAREVGRRINAETSAGLTKAVCDDPNCTIPRKPGRPMHGPHDYRAGGNS